MLRAPGAEGAWWDARQREVVCIPKYPGGKLEREGGETGRQEYELQRRNVKIVFLYHNDDTAYTKQYYQSYLILISKLTHKNVLHSYILAGTLTTNSASCKVIFFFLFLFCNILSHQIFAQGKPIINATPYCSSAVFDFEMCLMLCLQ